MLYTRFVFATGAIFVAAFAGSAASAGELMQNNAAHSGFYVAGFGGAAVLDDPDDFILPGVPIEFQIESDSETGYTIGSAVGYRWPVRFFGFLQPRTELEVSYLDSNFHGTNLTIRDLQAVFAYFNSYSELRFSDSQRLVPYIGGGVGAAFLNNDADDVGPTVFTRFAGHGAVGLTYELGGHAEIYTEGRYFRVSSVDLDARVEQRIEGYSVLGGLRWRFGG